MKKKFKIRTKLFLTLCVVIIMIIAFLIIVSGVVLETIYFHSKKDSSLLFYQYIDQNIDLILSGSYPEYITLLEKTAINNNFDVVILNKENQELYKTNKNFIPDFGIINDIPYEVEYSIFNKTDIMYSKDGVNIRRITDNKNGLTFLLLKADLSRDRDVYIRMAITPIKDSVDISNKFLLCMGIVTIGIGGIAIMFITQRFSKPIEELNDIANEMSNLNFERKYRIHDSDDEIDELGKSINTLSDKLETTIKQLRDNNSELEKDIEVKSKIDEMRKQFISDVSHELKTPISLIQGYAEGLIENVNTDEENRKFYAEVILDEANKMDKLVKRLLELMKLEYEDRNFNDTRFDIVELIHESIKNANVKLKEQEIEVEFNEKEPQYVYADDFYIEQVFTNYFTNAIKNVEKIGDSKKIKISIKKGKEEGKIRVTVFNTGKNISGENLNRIWTRFYKVDPSRDRSKGGTGIGLALVKAIMTKYNSQYGVSNKKDGVEFYFEIAEADEH